MTYTSFQKPDKIVMQKASDSHGLFELSPLERGYGVTIGNALRRTLLSSLEGFALTSVKIEGVDHEFSSISGVHEDMVEIVLNLKQVRFKKVSPESEDQETISFSISGQEKWTGKDISQVSNNFEVLNEDIVICHMEPSVNLQIELNVQKGRGYVPSEENKVEDNPIGVIAIDSIFTPIKRVNYKVDNTRVGQNVEYDKLTMDVTTDGSIHPKNALQEASQILNEHFKLFSNHNFVQGEMVPDEEEEMDDDFLHTKKLLKTSLDDLDLSVRAYNCLKGAGLETLGDLVKYDIEELLKFRNFGKKSKSELQAIVEEKGLSFGMDVSQYLEEENS